MEMIESLLKKYWSGSITTAECNLLMKLLEEKQHDKIDEYKQEVDFFNRPGSITSTVSNPDGLLEQIHRKIGSDKETGKKKNSIVYGLLRYGQWAAAIIVCLLVARLVVKKNSVENSLVAKTAESILPLINNISNTTDAIKQIQLTDGSAVKLYPGSTISFTDSFNISERVVRLEGKAFFKVAKDTTRRFSVLANDIVTTALGTEFMVDALKKDKNILIRLMEGKVVVYDKNNNRKPVYLLPGQECFVDCVEKSMKISQWKKVEVRKSPVIKKDTLSSSTGKSFEFNKTPLPDVFTTMERVYQIKINCEAIKDKKASFTGKFPVTISPEVLLTILCTTNDLSFEKMENIYFINILN